MCYSVETENEPRRLIMTDRDIISPPPSVYPEISLQDAQEEAVRLLGIQAGELLHLDD